jgi:hypothetical protein
MSTTFGRTYIDRRIELLVAGKTDQMVDEGYEDDAVLVSFDGQFKGKAALKEYFGKHIPDLGGLKLKSVDKLTETKDAIFVQLTVTTGKYGDVTSYEAFVLRGGEGKAEYHFTALK